MAIVLNQPGEAKAAAQTGALIGSAKKQERMEEQAERERARQAQIAAEQRAREWELEKMQMRSQQDFQQERRVRQAELDREARAEEWEVEKMELRSRIDFEKDEKERQRVMDLGRSRVEAYEKGAARGEYELSDPNISTGYEQAKFLRDVGDMGSATLFTPKREPAVKSPKNPLTEETRLISELIGTRGDAGLKDARDLAQTEATALGLDYNKLLADRMGAIPSVGPTVENAQQPTQTLPRPTTTAEWEKLPKGSQYIAPDRTVMRKK